MVLVDAIPTVCLSFEPVTLLAQLEISHRASRCNALTSLILCLTTMSRISQTEHLILKFPYFFDIGFQYHDILFDTNVQLCILISNKNMEAKANHPFIPGC